MLQPVQYVQRPNEKIGPFGTMIEKDPTINLLEQRLRQKIEEILPKEPEPPKISPMGVREVSFEDVLREMLAAKG
jgi:hypothetical protein